MKRCIARDARIVHQNRNRSEVRFDLFDAFGAGIKFADVEFVDRNADLICAGLSGGIIACVCGGYGVSIAYQSLTDGTTNTPGTSGDYCNFTHLILPKMDRRTSFVRFSDL